MRPGLWLLDLIWKVLDLIEKMLRQTPEAHAVSAAGLAVDRDVALFLLCVGCLKEFREFKKQWHFLWFSLIILECILLDIFFSLHIPPYIIKMKRRLLLYKLLCHLLFFLLHTMSCLYSMSVCMDVFEHWCGCCSSPLCRIYSNRFI